MGKTLVAEESELRVLGVDPGLASTGWGAIAFDSSTNKLTLLEYGVIETAPATPLAQRLELIFNGLTAVIERLRPGVAAVEQLYFSSNVQTAMAVAHGRGAAILATARRGLELHEISPPQIKQALTGHGRAGKQQVQMMVGALLQLDSIPKPDHAADALAAALCHIQMRGLNEKILRAREAGAPTELSDAALEARKALLAQRRGGKRKRR